MAARLKCSVQRPSSIAFALTAFGVALFIGLYLSSFLSVSDAYWSAETNGFPYRHYLLSDFKLFPLFFIGTLVLIYLFDTFRCLGKSVLKHRYLIAFIILLGCVALDINQSSIGAWTQYLGKDSPEGTLFGFPRRIRSDEWLVTTPQIFSQGATGFQPISSVLSGGNVNVTFVQALPSWSLPSLFHPFYWGYLFFGQSRGLSWFWFGRLVALCLATYDFAMVLTNKKSVLSATAALLVAFAPVVQWWGAHALVIYGEYLVVALNGCLNASSKRRFWAYGALISYLFCCYALELYPAWQVPFFYVFASTGAWVIWKHSRQNNMSVVKDTLRFVPVIAFAAVLCVCVVVFCLNYSHDAVVAMASSVYPGQRNMHADGGAKLSFAQDYYFNGLASMPVSPLITNDIKPNVCEVSTAISLSPLGLMMLILIGLRKKRPIGAFLLLPYLLFFIYGFIGMPDSIAIITLMSNTIWRRLLYPISYLDIMMLIYAISVNDEIQISEPQDKHDEFEGLNASIIAAVLFAWLMTYSMTTCVDSRISNIVPLLDYILFFLGTIIVLIPNRLVSCGRYVKSHHLLIWAMCVVCVGMCINPIQKGAGELLDDDIVKSVSSIVEDDPNALWIGDSDKEAQACVAAGARTLNSVQSFPHMEIWSKIDPNHEYEDIYNRFAHINIALSEETEYELPVHDVFVLRITDKDLVKLNVNYWLSKTDLATYDSDCVEFKPVASDDGTTIYKIIYR